MAEILGPFNQLSDTQLQRILTLWNSSYPVGINYKNLDTFKEFLLSLKDIKHYLILSEENYFEGWMMTFNRDGERWFSVIISQKNQGKGMGKSLISYVLKLEPALCGWVVDHDNDFKADGTPYLTPIEFYKKLGFSVVANQRFEKPGISCVKVSFKSPK